MALTGLTNLQPLHIKTVGIGTFDNTVSIGGTLTYEDVTNVDSVGIITARNGINLTGGGINAGILDLKTDNNIRLRINSSGQVGIGTNSPASDTNLHILDQTDRCRVILQSGGNESSQLWLQNPARTWKIHNYYDQNALTFTDDNDERLRITSTGLLNIGDADHLNEEYLGSTFKIQKDQNSVTRLVMRNENSGSGSASAVQIGAQGNSWMLQCGSAANDSNAFTIRVDGTSTVSYTHLTLPTNC